MQKLQNFDRFVSDHIIPLTFLCVFLGVCFDQAFNFLVPFTPFFFAVMTFVNTLGCNFKQMGHVLTHPVPILAIFLLLHVALPVLCLGLCRLLLPDAPLFTTGLILNFALPTGVLSLMWVTIGRGNLPLCLSAVLLDTFLSPIVVPLTMQLLAGSMVEMDAVGMMTDLLLMVVLPAFLALLCYYPQQGRAAAAWKPRLSPLAKVMLLVIIVSNSTGVAPFLRAFNATLMTVVAILLGLCCFAYWLGYFTATGLLHTDFPTAQTFAINTGLRNISAGAVLAAQYFPADVMFPVAFSPIFTQILLAITVRILRRTKAGQADQAAYEASQENQ